MKHYGDITKIKGSEVPPVDIVCGGSPCQDLSVAGARKGLAGERSGLFMEQIRVIKEINEYVAEQLSMRRSDEFVGFRPVRYMVWENVPGALSSGTPKSEDFRIVLEETAKIADKNATIPRPTNGKWTPSGCIMADRWSIAWRVHDAQFWGVPQRRKRISLVADFGGECAPKILFEREGLSGDIETSGKEGEGAAADAERGIRETVAVLNDQGGSVMSVSEDVTGALRAQEHGHQPIVYGISAYESNAMKSANPNSGIYEAETARTLDLNGGNPGCNQGGMAVVQGADVYNGELTGEKAATLTAASGASAAHSGPTVVQGLVHGCSIVRRLTPLEAERLQGFPDNWTNIGDWVDSKGKTHKGDSDSPRYKALGNSIALPFWAWMAERMMPYLPENPTMASLFDGIGGFPLVFSRCGCEPIWASEIEEFPIAVTKRRFPDEEEQLHTEQDTDKN